MVSPHEGSSPTIVESPQDAVVTNDQMNHISTILAIEKLIKSKNSNQLKSTSMKIINLLLSKII